MSDKVELDQRLSTLILTAASITFLVVVWLSRPAASEHFPKAMQDGLGLLLAALVFVLGFARQWQHSISAAALEAFHRSQEELLGAWSSRVDVALTSCELMDLALRRAHDAGVFRSLSIEMRSKETRRLVALTAKREAIRDEFENLGLLLAYRQAVADYAELKNTNPDYRIPEFWVVSKAELERFRREIPKLEKDRDRAGARLRVLQEASGEGTAELVTGPTRIRLATTTRALMQNARRFVTGMALLYVAGIIQAGPSLELLGSPELWVATLVMIVALTYVTLVTRDVENDLRFTADSVDQQPLVLLAQMDVALGEPHFFPADEAVERVVKAWNEHFWWRLRQVEVQAPGFTWTDSVRGRFELAQALNSGTYSERQRRQRDRHLQLAKQHLQRVPDDPLALVALARIREEQGDRDAAHLVTAAAQLLQRSRPWKPGERWDRTLSVTSLLETQSWLWPKDAGAVAVLKQAMAPTDEEAQNLDSDSDWDED